jgi:hypothetical protein
VLTALFEDADLPVTFTASGGDWVPYGIRSNGLPAADWADRILSETGRVYVFGTNGGGSVEYVDQRTSLSILADLNEYIVSGGVQYADTSTEGHHVDIAPGIEWVQQRVPASVKVVYLDTDDGEPVIESPAYSASDAGFPNATGPVVHLYDNAPKDANTADRATDLATAFYRRFKTGGMLARAVGWHSPEMGGSCTAVTWRLVYGMPYTDLEADVFSEIPRAVPDLNITAGDGVRAVRRPSGGVDLIADSGGSGFTIRAFITSATEIATDQNEYGFKQATGDPEPWNWEEKPEGIEGVFYQTMEGGDDTNLYSGVNRANLNGFQPVRLTIGARVILQKVDDAWYLSSVQAIDGECPPEGA